MWSRFLPQECLLSILFQFVISYSTLYKLANVYKKLFMFLTSTRIVNSFQLKIVFRKQKVFFPVFGVYWNMKTLYSLHKMSMLAFKMPRCLPQNRICYFSSWQDPSTNFWELSLKEEVVPLLYSMKYFLYD